VEVAQTLIGRRIASRAQALLAEQPAPVPRRDDLPPPAARAAAHRALDEGQTHYTSGPGILPLRAALAARSTADGFPASADEIVVTNGGAEALYVALQAAVRPGEAVLLGGPVSRRLRAMLDFVGASTVTPAFDPAHGFCVRPEEVARSKARVLLLASPSPLTGLALPGTTLTALLAAATEQGLTVILDRALAWCCYDPAAARCPEPALGARVLTTGSYSHAYAMHGWRAGYCAAPAEQFAPVRELKVAMSICTSSITQFAALAALAEGEDWLAARRATFAARRDRVVATLAGSDIAVVTPDAWPFVLLHAPGATADTATRLTGDLGMAISRAGDDDPALSDYLRVDLSATEGSGPT
jgi:aspartate/methionine/tyrosine aminotransferase